jgi:hypothetical protein
MSGYFILKSFISTLTIRLQKENAVLETEVAESEQILLTRTLRAAESTGPAAGSESVNLLRCA